MSIGEIAQLLFPKEDDGHDNQQQRNHHRNSFDPLFVSEGNHAPPRGTNLGRVCPHSAAPAVSDPRYVRLVVKNHIQRNRIGQHQGLLAGISLIQSGIGDVVKRQAQTREVIETIAKVDA